MNKSEAILRMSVIQTTYMNMINAFKDSDVDEKTLEEIQRYVDSLETAMKCLSGTEVLNKDIAENKYIAETEKAYQQGRKNAIREVEDKMYAQCFEKDNPEDMQKWDGGNWIRYKLFENVMEQIKEQKNEMD